MKLFNRNFILLIQGQAVSSFGDALFAVVLGLWIYDITGSSVMMGSIMAATMIPKIILGPFAGALADRASKKLLILSGDIIRGIGMCTVGALAFASLLEPWMLLLYGIIEGICQSFFNPAMQTVLPGIIPEDKLLKGNSLLQTAVSGTEILGSAVSGAIYVILGAPFMFLLDGISYLISAFTEGFIDYPRNAATVETTKQNFMEDIAAAMRYMLKNRGLLRIMLMAMLLNFLLAVITVVCVPWFADSSYLGKGLYGIFCAFQSGGVILGSLFTSLIDIKQKDRFKFALIGLCAEFLFIGIGAMSRNFIVIIFTITLAMTGLIIYNNITTAVLISSTPENMRGKVLAATLSLCTLASPLGKLAAGYIASVKSYELTLLIICALSLITALLLSCSRNVKRFYEL